MNAACWIDGKLDDRISVYDRGLHYGDGLFETLAVDAGRIVLLDSHLERLLEGCSRLKLAPPSIDLLRRELQSAADGQPRAVLKLVITRGAGGRGYRPSADTAATRILFRYPRSDHPRAYGEEGVSVRVCETRLGRNPLLAGLKHLNRLEQVLARSECGEEVQEGLMRDEEDFIVEGTMSNVFMVREDGRVVTPDLKRCGVSGVMRHYLLEQARLADLPVEVCDLPLADVMRAREMFLSNSLIGVWPVTRVGERSFVAGPVTRRFQRWAESA